MSCQNTICMLDLEPTTLTYNPNLAKVKVSPRAKHQDHRSNGLMVRAHTDGQMDATKRIIFPASRSINTVNSPIKAHCAEAAHSCAFVWKVDTESFTAVYTNPIFAQYRHVIYRWKALANLLECEKRGCAPIGSALLIENLRYVSHPGILTTYCNKGWFL